MDLNKKWKIWLIKIIKKNYQNAKNVPNLKPQVELKYKSRKQ